MNATEKGTEPRTPHRARFIVTTIAMAALTFAIAAGLAVLFRDDSGPVVADTAQERERLFRDDAHVLGEPGTEDVTLIEFLDFECEACRAMYPIIEDLREEYAGRVTFVARYFPLDSHTNAERAARAVEAAARQGAFEDMYVRMYETQESWGESKDPKDDLFREFADDLGLDLGQYDRDYASPDVAARVQRDIDDGTALGVRGTPTFFVDGTPLSIEDSDDAADFRRALDEALSD